MSQRAITALGGTQLLVDANTVTKPFTLTVVRPKVFKPRPSNALNGNGPQNTYKVITRKGVITNSYLGITAVANITTTISVPAGSEADDPNSIRALVSAHIGFLSDQSSNVSIMAVTGNM